MDLQKRWKNFLIIAEAVVLVFLIAVGMFVLYSYSTVEHDEEYNVVTEEGQETLMEENPALREEDPTLFQGPKELVRVDETSLRVPIDFSFWQERNPDVYAWIRIPDTNIDYPILQGGPDDSYYLDHTIDGVKGYPGSIYTESVNSKDFHDFNTVIYGHNMRNGTMFKHLHKFEDGEFFDSHEFFEVYTEEGTKIYRVYASVVYSDKHVMKAFDYDDPSGRKAFIDSLDTGESVNHFREGMNIDENSKLLTLATCIGGRPDNRWLVVAQLIEY